MVNTSQFQVEIGISLSVRVDDRAPVGTRIRVGQVLDREDGRVRVVALVVQSLLESVIFGDFLLKMKP